MRNKGMMTALIFTVVFFTTTPIMALPTKCVSRAVLTEGYEEHDDAQNIPSVRMTPHWETRESGRSYWRMANGKILKEPGLHTLGGKKYCLNVGGSRVEDAWKKIDGKVYYFQKNGIMRQKQGWIEWHGNKYYTNKGGSRFSGFRTVKGRFHYFDERGRILKNKKIL